MKSDRNSKTLFLMPVFSSLQLLLILFTVNHFVFAQQWTDYVNPFIGTGGHGHTFPGATVPFGMVQLSPDTRTEGWDACGGYHYSDNTILGFSHTHLSGTGIPDYGDILITPVVFAADKWQVTDASSPFSHRNEKSSPGYYSVTLDRYNIFAELTATKRVGVHRYTFPASENACIIIDLHHGLGTDRVLESNINIVGDYEIAGFRRSTGWAKDQYIYFVARFSRPFRDFAIASNDVLQHSIRSMEGEHIKALVRFETSEGEKIIVKVGISSVSIEGARKNLDAEMAGWDFDRTRSNAEKMWNAELGKIEVEGGTNEQRSAFYTALYHAMIAPNLFSDVDGRYRGMDGKIHTAKGFNMHTVFSLWDTFRAEHPLLTIIDQQRTRDFVESLLAKYDESGTLPVWELAANETWCMIGYHSVPVIVDAYLKGIQFDASRALEAIEHSASMDHFGLQSYCQSGYVQGELESESVSKTLEYAYDDWCIAQMAQQLKKDSVYDEFSRRAEYFQNVFDPQTGFMRPKVNGMWLAPFNPASVTNHYTEANPWQYSFFVPHDVDGLIELYAGKERFIKKLDSLFTTSSQLAGRQQADITGMIGQYAQGNEPSHHVAYLYDYAGAPWKTQQIVRTIMDSLYTSAVDGLCGNDDCGQMSAWYVMSALGLYQVCPGQPQYAIGSPLFPKATIHLENGKQFVITALNNLSSNKFIQSASLNGAAYSKSYIMHDDIVSGGELRFIMSPDPNPGWGSEDVPHSLPSAKIVATPFVSKGEPVFADSARIELACTTPGTIIYYTVDGTEPTSQSSIYSSPLLLKESATVKAIAVKDGINDSKLLSAEFKKFQTSGAIRLSSRYDDQYTAGGDDALVDGIRGKLDFRLGAWQGYHQVDLDAVIDLGKAKDIHTVSLGCLQDVTSWIWFPTSVEFSFSIDGTTFADTISVNNPVSPRETDIAIKDFTASLERIHARYVRVHAKNIGVCPPWHAGAGDKAWLFVDEIKVE